MTMSRLILSLGSNTGDSLQILQSAIHYLHSRVGDVVQIAPVYQSPSWQFKGKDFLNTVLEIQTNLTPAEILVKTQEIEKLLGRKNKSKGGKYSDRPIDIDILYIDNKILVTNELAVPHPLLHLRNFVLVPLNDILPDFLHPLLQKTTKELVTLSPDKTKLQKLEKQLNKYIELPYNFIAIEGNIGAGKTTFAKQFAADYNAKLVLERFEENAFLPKFYEDPKRYAFPLEMSFLADRYQQLTDDLAQYDLFKTSVISDYYVFKSLIFSKVTLSEEEYQLYRKIFNFMYRDLVKPDLYVYLYQDVERLLKNIKKRGREYEQSIQPEYLKQIHDGYMNFIKTRKDLNILILNISSIDFVQNPEYYQQMLEKILNHKPQKGSKIEYIL